MVSLAAADGLMDEKLSKNSSLPNPFQAPIQTSSLYASPFTSQFSGKKFIALNSATNIESTSNSRNIRSSPRFHLPFRCSGEFKVNFNSDAHRPPQQEFKKNQFHKKFNNHRREFFCDPCDRGFKDSEELNQHLCQHTKCWLNDCTFEGHIKIVERHIKMQHDSGLIERIGSLDTPEDIQKWREERKKKFPTAQRIEENKGSVQNEMRKSNRQSFGRGKNRGSFNRNTAWPPEQMPNDWPFPRGRGQGRGRGRKRNRGPNKGFIANMTSLTSQKEIDDAIPKNNQCADARNSASTDHMQYFVDNGNDDDDECPDEIPIQKSDPFPIKSTVDSPPKLTGALASLVADYGSEDDEETTENNEKIIQPTEEKQLIESKEKVNSKRKRRKEFNQNPSKRNTQFRPQFQTRPRQTSLLEKLLANDIKKERDTIFQCVQYIVKNNFFGRNT